MDTRLFKVEGRATQDVDWCIVVEAKDETSAKVLAVRGIGAIYGSECRNIQAQKVEDVTEEEARQEPGSFGPSTEHPYPLEDFQEVRREVGQHLDGHYD